MVERQPSGARVPREMREGATGVVDGTLAERLTATDAGLRVVSEDHESGASGDYLGWHVDGWVAWAGLILWLGTLGRLAYGGPPRRATRWAWFWLLLLVPVGPVAYLLAGGPATGSVHSDTSRRLTGGWAFLILLVVSPAFAAGAG